MTTREEKRLATCQACDQYHKLLKICLDCKCYIPMKVKLGWSKCPRGKW